MNTEKIDEIIKQLARIANELEILNKEGLVVFGGQTMEEN